MAILTSKCKWPQLLLLLTFIIETLGEFRDPTPSTFQPTSKHFIVVLEEPSVATSSRGAALRQARSRRASAAGDTSGSVTAAAADEYANELYGRQRAVFDAAIGASPDAGRTAPGASPRIVRQLAYALNGFTAAGLSDAQVQALRKQPGVLSVTRSSLKRTQTISTPSFLNIEGPIWQQQYGGAANASASVLVGVIDTGIEPSRESFAPVARAANPWPSLGPGSAACNESGTCTAGKLVACRYFMDAFAEAIAGYEDIFELLLADSCRDSNGHGSHTAGTSAGGANVTVEIGGAPMPGGARMSGMAPGAGLAVYKALWDLFDKITGEVQDGGTTADIVAAIEAAVQDGVDVINYSVGSSAPAFGISEPTWMAFRGAAAAGVLVAAAGGNSGGNFTVDNNMPWAITVAAGTHNRVLNATVTISGAPGAGTWPGAMLQVAPYGPAPLYHNDAYYFASRCISGTLGREAAGKVVLCFRGVNLRNEKSLEVYRVGGVGMILMNSEDIADDGVYSDVHSVPTIHVNTEHGKAILAAYKAAPNNATATMSGGSYFFNSTEAPFVAGFSSRGPSITDSSALLKPDVLAPGVDVVAAYANVSGSNDTAAPLSGTSMAAPHIAGIAALVMGKHPDWSPAAVKSAIMTTASQVTNLGNPLTGGSFDYGAGMVDPVKALDPGLVYDAGDLDYARYLCTTLKDTSWAKKLQDGEKKPQTPSECKAACAKPNPPCSFPQTLRDFNAPSFSLPAIKKGATAKAARNVTFVGSGAPTFTAKVRLPDGFVAAINPPTNKKPVAGSDLSLSFASAGEWKQYALFITVPKTAAPDWYFGNVTWTDDAGKHAVYSAIAIQVI